METTEKKSEAEELALKFAESKERAGCAFFNGLYQGFIAGYEAHQKKEIPDKMGNFANDTFVKSVCRSGYGCQYQTPNTTDCKSPVGCVHKQTISYIHGKNNV
jgi:hypothetical protein